MCYKVKDNGDVRSFYSIDDKTLYIVQDEAITSVCYPCTSTKTYHPDLSDMRGIFVWDHTKYIIFNKTTVCEYASWFAGLSLRGAAYVRRLVTTAICYDVIFSK